jgi:hypothetical protein
VTSELQQQQQRSFCLSATQEATTSDTILRWEEGIESALADGVVQIFFSLEVGTGIWSFENFMLCFYVAILRFGFSLIVQPISEAFVSLFSSHMASNSLCVLFQALSEL